MIRGQFETKTGLIKVEIPDVGTTETVEISDLSTIKYEFDLIPDSPDVDSVQALYNKVDIEIFQFSDSQVDLYDRLLGQLIGGNALPVNLFLDSDQFGFFIEINDIKLNEIDRTITLKSRVRYNSTATVLSVFDDIQTADPTKLKTFRPDPDVSAEELDCVGVADWIAQGMKSVFTNNFTSIVRSAPTSSPQNYNQFNYTFLPDAPLGDTVGLIMARLNKADFITFTGYTSVNSFVTHVGGNIFTGANFTAILDVGDKVLLGDSPSGEPLIEVDVIDIISDSKMELSDAPTTLSQTFLWSYRKKNDLSNYLAVDSLKELAAIEGSIFGTGFSRNFYVNRIQEQDVVTIDWDEVTENDIEPFFNPIGKAENEQLASTFSDPINKTLKEGYDNFGVIPVSSGTWQLPKILGGISQLKPIPGNNEEVNLRLAPGYPFLNKAISRVLINRYDGEYSAPESWNIDFEPILALCRTGLRSYVRSLSSDGRGIVIDFTAFKARSVKPWNLVQFVNAPDKYMGKLFRPTTIDYDIVRDLVSIKAYELVDADIPEPDLSIEVFLESESTMIVTTEFIGIPEPTSVSLILNTTESTLSWNTPSLGTPDTYSIQYAIDSGSGFGAWNSLVTGLSGSLTSHTFDACAIASNNDVIKCRIQAIFPSVTSEWVESNNDTLTGCV